MKKLVMLSTAFISVTLLLAACETKQSTEQLLKDNEQRKEAIKIIAHSEPYMTEMMTEMMSNDTCKKMMHNAMMKDARSMDMMMMPMMEMCEKDTAMCSKMMKMMHQKPMIMSKMKEMNGMNMHAKDKMYTCTMHPEVQSDKPGKCPKCNMDLVMKKDHKM